MGMFDFLKSRLSATPGAQAMAPDGQMMQSAPVLREQPGLIDKVKSAYAGGPSFQDRALMAMLALQGDAGAAMRMRMGLREERRDEEERQRRNGALKAAYDPATGKFDRNRYMQGGGDMVDSLEIERAIATLAPKREVVEGPDGIYERGENGWRRAMDYPVEPEKLPRPPAGFQWNDDGTELELIPGYAEGVSQVSGVRREAVTSRPMPRTGGGGSGGRPRSYSADEVSW